MSASPFQQAPAPSGPHASRQAAADRRDPRPLRAATSAVLLDFRGLTVAKTTQAAQPVPQGGRRVPRREEHARQDRDQGHEARHRRRSRTALAGETAIAWTYEDPSIAAKLVKEFRKDETIAQKLTIKCGVLENQVMRGERRSRPSSRPCPARTKSGRCCSRSCMAPAQKLVMQLAGAGAEPRLRARRAQAAARRTEVIATINQLWLLNGSWIMETVRWQA